MASPFCTRISRSAVLVVGLLLSSPQAARGQSGDAPTKAPVEQEKPGTISPPVAVRTPLKYPTWGEGVHVLILELLVLKDGSVKEARVVSGDEKFGAVAAEAARTWSFQPARRDGERVAAWIRFEVRFDPPEEAGAASQDEVQQPTGVTESSAEGGVQTGTAQAATESGELEVLVQGEREAQKEGARSLSRASVRQLPGAFGDAFRAVETLPGVTPIVSGLPYFYVRGAPPGNVGYFLDGVRVPLLFHIGAGPSVIHPAFIDRVDLYAGPYPARYGRFAGGIIAGETSAPTYDTRGEVSIRLVDSGAMVETHAFDRRLSIMAAGRYSYTALVASLLAPDLNLSYWDYQGRLNYDLSDKESLTLFAFGALDQASEEPPGGPKTTIFDLIFHRADLRYDRRFDDGGTMRVAFLGGTEVTSLGDFAIRDRLLGGRVELENPLAENLTLRSGVDLQTDHYSVALDDEVFQAEDAGGDDRTEDLLPERTDIVTGARADFVWEAAPGVRVIPGLRFDFFVTDGTPLWALSPRLYAEFDVRRDFTIKHGLGVAHQLPSFVVPLPGVQLVGDLALQRSIQHSAGVEWRMPEQFVAEGTVFQNIQLNTTDTLSAIRFGQQDGRIDARGPGSGRGFELMVRRPLTERLGGYLSYTFSRSTRSFGRERGPSSFDRTHVLSSALGYQMGKGWTGGIRGSFYTGVPANPLGTEFSFSAPPRTRPFYRVDWRLEKKWTVGNQGAWWALVFEVLNTTLNKEQLSLDCSETPCQGESFGPVTIPSIGAEASF